MPGRSVSRALAAVVLAAGCHGGSGAGADAYDDSTPAAQSCDRLFDAVSAANSYPKPLGLPTVVFPLGLDLVPPIDCADPAPDDVRAALKARFGRHCVDQITACGSGITTAWIDACAAALAKQPCGGGLPDACALPPPGTLDAGAACFEGIQCSSLSCGMGSCQTVLPLGSQCDDPNCGYAHAPPGTPLCARGTECQTAQLTCTGTCVSVPLSVTNQAAPGKPCNDALGPHCTDGATCTGGICRGSAGTPCPDDYAACAAGTYCEQLPAGSWCEPLGSLGAAGAACQSFSNCIPGLICNSSHVCASPGGPGVTCQVDVDCAFGLHCSGGSCALNTPNGSACPPASCDSPFSICGPQHQCVAVQVGAAWPGQPCCTDCGTRCAVGDCPDADGGAAPASCPTLADLGQPCGDDATCGPYAQCQVGVCVWPAPPPCGP